MFWIVSLLPNSLSVALADKDQILATGSSLTWNPEDDSIISAVDQSLSQAATSQNLSSQDEPSSTAFILPPDWVGADGKIISPILQKIEILCRQLKLQPMGFVGQDEAIIDSLSTFEGVPPSFILLNFYSQSFDLSVVFLGKTKQKIRRQFTLPPTPTLIETALSELASESTLPPRIIVFGDIDSSFTTDLANFPWLGKQNIETFLQLPEVTFYSPADLAKINLSVISSQFTPNDSPAASFPPQEEPESDVLSPLNQVSAQSLGFASEILTTESQVPPPPSPLASPPPPRSKIKFKLNLPPLRLPRPKIFLFLLPLPVVFFLIIYFMPSRLTLYLNPYIVSQRHPVTLSTKINSIDTAKGLIPATPKTFTVSTTASTATTGQRQIGDKARGEVIVYNQQNRTQDLPKGTVLVDASGKEFELFVATSITASSFDLDAGIVTLGQTKASVVASDIGPDYNLAKDTKFTFKDFSDATILAKAVTDFSGGSRETVPAVSAVDKTNLEKEITPQLESLISQKIDQEIKNNSNLIKGSAQIKKDRLEYSREVNEEADQLSATLTASVTLYSLSVPASEVISQFLHLDPTLPQLDFDYQQSQFSFEVTTTDDDQVSGFIDIQGQGLSRLDLDTLRRALVFKTPAQVTKILRHQVDRLYNFQLRPSFLTPLRFQNITIDIQTRR